jgi:large subunit ribosomal protein L21
MFAVIKTGGKQYKVAAADRITVMALEGEAGAQVTFSEVLALFDGERSEIGAPHVAGASVVGEIVEQTRGPKVIAFKKRRRKNSRRKRGHRQDLTIVRITQILTGGAEPATAKPAAAPLEGEAPTPAAAAESIEEAPAKPAAAPLKAETPAPEAAKTAEAATAKPAAAAKAEAPAGAAGTEAAETAGLAASKAKRPKKAAPPKTGARRDDHEG